MMTCHNRAACTVACLESIHAQIGLSDHDVSVVVVDDGSSDGTSHLVARRFPDVKLHHGDGNLFWAGGMRRAFEIARAMNPDVYVWVNDDTVLAADALVMLLDNSRGVDTALDAATIVVGATRDPITGDTSYSGWRRRGACAPGHFDKVPPNGEPVLCDTFNGNCVLISSEVVRRIGILDPAFTHSMGDFDYGLRATDAGCKIVLAPRHVGVCQSNLGSGSWVDETLGVRDRWRRLCGPKGLPPKEWLVFTRRHHGVLWPLYWLNPYAKFLLKAAWRTFVPLRSSKNKC